MHHFSHSQIIAKPATSSRGGVVAAQHRRAAEIGAAVLREGGHAVDAAVVSFAIGVLEPWMSGPAGGGAMMLWDAEASKAHALFYGMRSPRGLDPADFPLAATPGATSDLFPWKPVVDDRNVVGASAVAVPGVVDGIGEAHRRFGRMPWAELVAPAVSLAREGLLVDWYAALMIASATRSLAKDGDAARLFLDDGQWPTIAGWTATAEKRVALLGLAETLEALACGGHRAFYEGDVGIARQSV